MIDTPFSARRAMVALALAVTAGAMAGCAIAPVTPTTALPARPEAQAHRVDEGLGREGVTLERGAPPVARRPEPPPTMHGLPMADDAPELPSPVPSTRWPSPATGPWSYACSLSLDPAIGRASSLAWEPSRRLPLGITAEETACVVFD